VRSDSSEKMGGFKEKKAVGRSFVAGKMGTCPTGIWERRRKHDTFQKKKKRGKNKSARERE